MTLRSLALGLLAPALLLTASSEAQPVSATVTLVQDTPPKPRSIPRGGKTPPAKQGQTPATKKPDQGTGGADGGKGTPSRQGQPVVKPLDPNDPNYEKLKEKYRNAGYDEKGYPISKAEAKGDAKGDRFREVGKGGGPVMDVPTDPNAKLAIDFGADKHDFGRARQGDMLEHIFELKSAGTAPLIIRQVKPTCGCTVSQTLVETEKGTMVPYVDGDPIPPGRKITIAGRMNTANKKNQVQVRMNVYHNDPTGTTGLALMANIEPFITATPTYVQLGDIPQGASRTHTVDVRTTRGEKVNLVIDERPGVQMPQGMTVALAAVSPDEDGRSNHWRATVEIGPDAKEGNIGWQISMKSDQPRPDKAELEAQNAEHAHNEAEGGVDEHGHKVPTHQVDTEYKINVAVSGRILGVLSHTPQFVSMGLVRPGQVVPRTVKLISHDPEFSFDPENMKIELTGDAGVDLRWAEHFATSAKPAQGVNGVDVELRLTGLPEGADGSFRGKMIIHTGNPAKPTTEVRFSGVCRAGIQGGGR